MTSKASALLSENSGVMRRVVLSDLSFVSDTSSSTLRGRGGVQVGTGWGVGTPFSVGRPASVVDFWHQEYSRPTLSSVRSYYNHLEIKSGPFETVVNAKSRIGESCSANPLPFPAPPEYLDSRERDGKHRASQQSVRMTVDEGRRNWQQQKRVPRQP